MVKSGSVTPRGTIDWWIVRRLNTVGDHHDDGGIGAVHDEQNGGWARDGRSNGRNGRLR